MDQTPRLSLAPIFTDGMVLQRDEPLRLWGTGAPGDKLTISFTDRIYQTSVDSAGSWQLELSPLSAGGPYQLRITGREELVVDDVLLGDVWLLGGQSNMELPVSRTLDLYEAEVSAANNPWIRQFSVPMHYDFSGPCQTIPGGAWQSVTPQSVLEFSALGYFFALCHYEKYQVPVGLVLTAVGGTPIEAWMSEELLRQLDRFEEQDPEMVRTTIERELVATEDWYAKLAAQDPDYSDPSLDDSNWPSLSLPQFWQGSELEPVKGSVWFRKTIQIPAEVLEAHAGENALLRLGAIVDADRVYMNGILVGQTEYKYPPRKYRVPPGVLQAGANTLAVQVIVNRGIGGFVTEKEYSLSLGKYKVDLTGHWRYKVGVVMPTLPQLTFFQYKPSGVYNGMIAPLKDYGFKAVLWYQGESNTGSPDGYERLFKEFIQNWRATFAKPDLPFIFVQLANFDSRLEGEKNLGWAEIREAQRQALALPHTGMVVSIDLGEAKDLHPQNKKDLAERMALVVQDVVYGEEVISQGPSCEAIRVEDGVAIVTMGNAGSGLVSRGGELRGFELAKADGRFHPAQAAIKASTIRIWSSKVTKPSAVRYAWDDNPSQANLYNEEGLPASPFVVFAEE